MAKNQDLYDTIVNVLNNWKNEHKAKPNSVMPSDDDIRSDVENATESFLEQVGTGDDDKKAA